MTIDDLVREFHTAMDIPIVETPSVPSDARVRLRASLIAEEFFETMAAMFADDRAWLEQAKNCVAEAVSENRVKVDLVELADGLCDLDYVVAGTRLEFGIPGEAVLAEVHAANMRKTDGPIREDGKRLKPPGWVGPDVAGVLEKHKHGASCTHGVTFDEEAARGMRANAIRERWPRLMGTCPLGCGWHGIYYASFAHYISGDW